MLIVKGDIASFDLVDGFTLAVPDDFGLIHDPTGKTLDKCTVYLCPYMLYPKQAPRIPKRLVQTVVDYFGDETPLARAVVEIPKGPWHRLGVVKQIHYTRYGKLPNGDKADGPFYHPFEDSEVPAIVLLESHSERGLKLELPDGCVINERGFVKP